MTARSTRAVRVGALTTALLLTGSAALAFLTSTGAGAGSAGTNTLNPPTNVAGSASGSTVALTWTGTTAPGGGAVSGYYVQRSVGTPAGTCASSPSALLAPSAVSCNDTGVAAGTYSYTVVAVFRTWTAGATGPPVTVAPSAADHFVVTAPATATAGTAFTVTVTAQDISNATFTGYSGAKTIVWSGPGSAPGSAPTYPATVTFTNGVGTASITLTKAETTTLTATEGALTGTSGSVVVGTATAARLAWTQVTTSGGTLSSPCLFTCTAAGVGNFGTFTARVAVTDSSGNTVSNLGSAHTVTVSTPTTGPTSGGSFTAPSPGGTSVTLTIPGAGTAESTATFTFRATNGNWVSNTFTAAVTTGTAYTSASGSVTKQP